MTDHQNLRDRREVIIAGIGAGVAVAAAGLPWQEVAAKSLNNQDSSFPIPLRSDHVMLGVDDMEAIIAWYRDKLGFVIEKAWTVDGLPGIQLAYITGHNYRIELISGGRGPRTPDPESFDKHFRMRGFQHLCFWADDVDAVMAELNKRGVATFFPATDFPKGAERRVAFVKDPEGNVIEFAGLLKG